MGKHAIPDAIAIAEAGERVVADVFQLKDGATLPELEQLARDGRAFADRLHDAHEHAKSARQAAESAR